MIYILHVINRALLLLLLHKAQLVRHPFSNDEEDRNQEDTERRRKEHTADDRDAHAIACCGTCACCYR